MSIGRRVIKNTFFLYIRMFVILFISLYTTRVLLRQLGAVDYGLNNVVAGVVAMSSFIVGAMSNASTRFFAFALGQEDPGERKRIFQSTLTIYFGFVVLIIILTETVGLWFVNNRLNIPPERMVATRWIYQFSILSLVFSFIRVPYNSSIIAHERMDFYAWTSILEVLLKLAVVFLLVLDGGDRLIRYGVLTFLVTAFITFVFIFYCQARFEECVFRLRYNREDSAGILRFAGWHFVSSMGDVALDQGINIVLNLFFGPVINAARGLAYSVKSQVAAFVGNFQVAATPQITKLYAAGDKPAMQRLMLQTSKVSFILMIIITVPAFIGADWLLDVWLDEVPEFTTLFVRLMMVNILVDSLGGTMNIGINATGRIAAYFLTISIFKLLTVAVVYILFRFFSLPPEYSVICTIGYSVLSIIIKVLIYSHTVGLPVSEYISGVILPDLGVLVVSLALILPCFLLFDLTSLPVLLAVLFYAFCVSTLVGLFVGCSREERMSLWDILKKKAGRV